jgi:integrase
MKRTLPAKDRSISAAQYLKAGSSGKSEKAHATEYRIADNPGLVLVVMQSKANEQSRRIWRCHYSVTRDGQRHRRKMRLGTYPFTTLADARATAATIMAEVDRGGDPFVDRKKVAAAEQRARLTFANLVDDYLEERRGLASAAEIERELRKDAIPVLGSRRPAEITPADIDRLASTLLEPERDTKVMARRLISRLKALFSYALLDAPSLAEKYGLVTNPAASVGRRRPGSEGRFGRPKPRTRVLLDAEIRAFWHALNASNMRQGTQLALKLGLVTAQRPGELRLARKTELHLELPQPLWIIPSEHSKNKRPHVVPLSPLACRLFTEALAIDRGSASHLVLPGPDGADVPAAKTVIPTAMASLFRSHLSNLMPATPHDLRRTATTGMRALGVTRETVSRILNHASVGVTAQHYDHHEAMPERRNALFKWCAHLELILGPDLKDGA